MWIKLIGLVLLLAIEFVLVTNGKKIVCYYGSWAGYRPGNGNFQISKIQPKLCTHLIYSFIGLNPDGSIKILDKHNDIDLGGFKKFNDLKKGYPNVKTLIAIGGWNEGSTNYSIVANNPTLRKAFIKNALKFVQKYNFDGFDIDWEYPGQRGGHPYDKVNFGILLKEFRKAAGPDFLLTAAVGATESTIEKSYDVATIAKYLSFINVMTYDLHGAYDGVTGENAPLYPAPHEVTHWQQQTNVAVCITAWIDYGAPPEKLVLGIGTYGRTFTLKSTGNTGINAPITGPGLPGRYTNESGMLGYNEICEMQQTQLWTTVWNDVQKVPYSYKGKQWVGYDDPRSIAEKVKFAKSRKLGGLMVWSIETDDFRGICGRQYPLLHAINSNL